MEGNLQKEVMRREEILLKINLINLCEIPKEQMIGNTVSGVV